MKRALFAVALTALAFVGTASVQATGGSDAIDQLAITSDGMPRNLSDYGFFAGSPDRPNPALIPYSVRNPLFSDYAEKARFISLPEDAYLHVGPDGRVDFPVGTALIKSFAYRTDAGGLDTIETRVLLHRADGWLALPYVWNEDRTDAVLKVAGARMDVVFDDPSGERHEISYGVPNKNQCKQCHNRDGKLSPIGPVWPDMEFPREGDHERLKELASFPRNGLFATPRWDDPAEPIARRAGAYLQANCAHCHSRSGSASNSGLFYDERLGEYAVSGYLKRPVAAGRGSGSFDFIVDPGHPERSILLYRMHSLDPGVAMPEIGRATAHTEGLAVVTEWIAGLETRN